MNGSTTHISPSELSLFGRIVSRLERLDNGSDAREIIFPDIIKLVRADFAASYRFNKESRRFERGLVYNIDPANISRYNEWYQFHDPHTFALRARRRATPVEAVMSYKELRRTEFYNDFLRRDGLHHGVNLFLFDGERDVGDFRLWRAASSPEFSSREIVLLDTLAPHLQRAFSRNCQLRENLTSREQQVSALVAKGCRDRDIARMLGLSFSTVRTHLNRAMEKKCCANRAELAAMFASMPSASLDTGTVPSE